MLSLRKLFLSREIQYWCQFCNGVMVKNVWYCSEAEGLLWVISTWLRYLARAGIIVGSHNPL